jgi:hypothetical protein
MRYADKQDESGNLRHWEAECRTMRILRAGGFRRRTGAFSRDWLMWRARLSHAVPI